MKKKVVQLCIIGIVVFMAGMNLTQGMKKTKISDILLENIDAFAMGMDENGYLWPGYEYVKHESNEGGPGMTTVCSGHGWLYCV